MHSHQPFFLFIMQSMAETVLAMWEQEKITPFTYFYDHANGKMVLHKPLLHQHLLLQPVQSVMHLILLLYVDNGALYFTSYEDMEKGVSMFESQMKRFGLIMHVGQENVPSKSEFMYVPCITRTREIIKDFLKRTCITHVTAQDNNQLCKKNSSGVR